MRESYSLKKATQVLALTLLIIYISVPGNCQVGIKSNKPVMMFGDSARTGVPFSKDPHVIRFQNRFLMYYSVPGY
jgi:beta-1,2-mannobiose phosphorylase / 1,2-beta-oligomannan phosphorylase